MKPFQLHQPATQAEALALLAECQQRGDDVHLMAGGTSLVLLMNLGLLQATHIIALRNISELHGIQSTPGGGLAIRPLATHRELELSPAVQAYCPALAETFGHVATVRIRNQATLGGNLAHADPAQDPPPMLIALDAQIVLTSQTGERSLPLEQFFVDYLTTTLQPGELLTEIRLPPLPAGTRATYQKFLPRTQDDYATVSVAATLRVDADGRCADVRVALGGAAGTPVHLREVEDALRGEKLTDQRIADAAARVPELVDPPDDARGSATYKRRMARVWTARALHDLRDQPNGALPTP
ncbi:MAG TPA: xanthine dehydrogenase family protein subunit M [Chloroflexota bacterium]|nr:xanthine dehydrogenase family protein subunit M [Chloroflexota bacterium]